VFSVLPASRWQALVVRRIGEWLLRSCAIVALSAGPDAGGTQNAYPRPRIASAQNNSVLRGRGRPRSMTLAFLNPSRTIHLGVK